MSGVGTSIGALILELARLIWYPKKRGASQIPHAHKPGADSRIVRKLSPAGLKMWDVEAHLRISLSLTLVEFRVGPFGPWQVAMPSLTMWLATHFGLGEQRHPDVELVLRGGHCCRASSGSGRGKQQQQEGQQQQQQKKQQARGRHG